MRAAETRLHLRVEIENSIHPIPWVPPRISTSTVGTVQTIWVISFQFKPLESVLDFGGRWILNSMG